MQNSIIFSLEDIPAQEQQTRVIIIVLSTCIVCIEIKVIIIIEFERQICENKKR